MDKSISMREELGEEITSLITKKYFAEKMGINLRSFQMKLAGGETTCQCYRGKEEPKMFKASFTPRERMAFAATLRDVARKFNSAAAEIEMTTPDDGNLY